MMLLASASVSLIALIGIIFVKLNEEKTKRISHFLISFAAGTLLGAVFFDILPEAIEHSAEYGGEIDPVFLAAVVGFILFFVFEKTLIWYHRHDEHHAREIPRAQTGPLILFGDAVHNFIDGIIIGLSFLADPALGVTATIAIAFHEIPQEIGDFSVLLHSGFSKGYALFFNFLVATTTILGALFAYFVSSAVNLDTFLPIALGLISGGFIYIASVDLIPEINKETRLGHSIATSALFVIGLATIYTVAQLLPHG